jgi:hypothetical protein
MSQLGLKDHEMNLTSPSGVPSQWFAYPGSDETSRLGVLDIPKIPDT